MIQDFDEDYEGESKEDEDNDNIVRAKGPMSRLFSSILATMLQESTEDSQQGYIPALSDNSLHPTNLNLLHYFSY